MNLKNKRIIINKINQIGDVTFSLPLASALKQLEPSCKIIFLAREYTRALVENYADVDEFADWEAMSKNGLEAATAGLRALQADIIIHVTSPSKYYRATYIAAKKAGIPLRIGTARKFHSWLTCNRFVNISRSKSSLHETQLDMLFLKPLGGKKHYSLDEVIALQHYKPFKKTAECLQLLDPQKFNLILHPKTRGEHIEWPAKNFATLIQSLPTEHFNIFVTGNTKEGEQVREAMLEPFPQVHDLCGKISLNDLIELIAHADGMVCASTGPVHLAANFGIYTLGLYAPIKPFHAGRWGPVGPKAETLTLQKNCEACRYSAPCHCIAAITPHQVLAVLQRWQKQK